MLNRMADQGVFNLTLPGWYTYTALLAGILWILYVVYPLLTTLEVRRKAGAQSDYDKSLTTKGAQTDQAKYLPPGDDCAICLESLNHSQAKCCTLPCAHVFHVQCIEELRSSLCIAQVCPLCRTDLPLEPKPMASVSGLLSSHMPTPASRSSLFAVAANGLLVRGGGSFIT